MTVYSAMTAIADAIRAKDGSTAELTLDAMPIAIAAIQTGAALTLLVSVDSGALVTATLGNTVVTGASVDGVATLTLPEGGTWSVAATLNGETSSTVQVEVSVGYETEVVFIPPVGTALNNVSWANISRIATAGLAASYFAVGDCKAVALNGTVGALTFSNDTYYTYILGINHNAELEGANLIHFQFGKTAASDGIDICFDGSFSMNTAADNSGGWKSSYMRSTICPAFASVLPPDLQSVLATVTKYTNNTGRASTAASAITATTDTVFPPSEYEVFGSISYSNTNEASKQAQYAYYAAGNSKVKYKHSATGTAASWQLRSARAGDYSNFAIVLYGGAVHHSQAGIVNGFAPCFCVGGEAA